LLYCLHDLGALDLDPAAAGLAAVISGHSHQPRIERRGGVLYINPGSAGPRRFSLPRAAGILEASGRHVSVQLFDVATDSTPALGPPFEADL
jgi:predicted phosphodiesterase